MKIDVCVPSFTCQLVTAAQCAVVTAAALVIAWLLVGSVLITSRAVTRKNPRGCIIISSEVHKAGPQR